MNPSPRIRFCAAMVALALVPAIAAAQTEELAPPATFSPLDPVRLAADFAPDAPAVPAVAPFEQAAEVSTGSPADSLAPSDSLPVSAPQTLPAGPVRTAAAPVEQPPLVGSIVGALVGGAVGLFGGGGLGLVAYEELDYHHESMEALGPVFLGASVGEVFLMPLGAHVGNGGRGSYWTAFGGSLLGYVATLGLSFAGPLGTTAGLLLQTGFTVAGERLSAKRLATGRTAESASP